MRNASQFRQLARNKLAGKWGISILVSLVAAVLTGLTLSLNIDFSSINDLFNKVFGKPDAINAFLAQLGVNMRALSFTLRAMRPFIFMLSVARFLLSGAIMLGLCSYYTGLIRGQEVDLNTLFSKFRLFGKGLLLYLYTSLLIFAWSLLFVVPGIVAAYRYSLAFYLLTDNPDMGVAECVIESKRLMLGHKGRLFCLPNDPESFQCKADPEGKGGAPDKNGEIIEISMDGLYAAAMRQAAEEVVKIIESCR